MAFDYKKEYKEFYMPKSKPEIVTVPSMNYIAVRGTGNPNEEGGAYKASIGLLYGIAFTIKMSKKGDRQIEGYFDYVVPPLEGFWWQDGIDGFDYTRKDLFHGSLLSGSRILSGRRISSGQLRRRKRRKNRTSPPSSS